MKNKLIPVILVASAVLAGCKPEQNTSAPTVDPGDAIAEVNGIYIGKASLEKLQEELAKRRGGQTIPEQQLIEELVNRELLIQEAQKKKLDQSPEFAAEMQSIQNSLLAQSALQDFMKANPVNDADLQAEYDKQVGSQGGEEYKARHILIGIDDPEAEAKAKAIIAKLEKGGDFEVLAKENSTGPSAPNGGDLGWFTAQQMVPPFTEAVIALENGKYTVEPVETQFGWHVILREDSRAKTPPPLEAIKAQLLPMLQRQKAQTYMEGLRNQADVKIMASAPEATETLEVEEVVIEKEPKTTSSEQPATEQQ